MKDIEFDKISLVVLLFAAIFLFAGLGGLIYEVVCDAIVYDRYFASCFGLAVICIIISLVFAVLELLND
jgi:hypothetical protein